MIMITKNILTLWNKMKLVKYWNKSTLNYLGRDKYGNDWFAGNKGGNQIWVQSRNGKITNAGQNSAGNFKSFNPQTGLKSPTIPKK